MGRVVRERDSRDTRTLLLEQPCETLSAGSGRHSRTFPRAGAVGSTRPSRRLPEFDRLIITDLDNTLTGDDESLAEFVDLIRENDHVGFGIATGRRLDSAMALIEELGLPRPDLIDTDVGTQLHYGENLTPDRSWRKAIGYAWKPDEIREVLDELPGLFPQKEENQSEFKISYEVDTNVEPQRQHDQENPPRSGAAC